MCVRAILTFFRLDQRVSSFIYESCNNSYIIPKSREAVCTRRWLVIGGKYAYSGGKRTGLSARSEMIPYARSCHPASTAVNSVCLFLPRIAGNYKPADSLIERN